MKVFIAEECNVKFYLINAILEKVANWAEIRSEILALAVFGFLCAG